MPFTCSYQGCNTTASKICGGIQYCSVHISPAMRGMCNVETTKRGDMIEKLEATMLNLPKSGRNIDKKATIRNVNMKNATHDIILKVNVFFQWWPYILTLLKILCSIVMIGCTATHLDTTSILLYGCIKGPFDFLYSTRKKLVERNNMNYSLYKWYNIKISCILFMIATLYETYILPTNSKYVLLAASQYATISLMNMYRCSKVDVNNPTKPVNGNIINDGISGISNILISKLMIYYGLFMDIQCCFVVPTIIYNNSLYLNIHSLVGILCALILYR